LGAIGFQFLDSVVHQLEDLIAITGYVMHIDSFR